jgi:hypothetical protein
MNALFSLLAALVALLSPLFAADAAKVTITAKTRVVDSDHDLRGKFGDTGQKTVTLKVTIVNTSGGPLEASELTGDMLVKRVRDGKEKIVKEPLGKIAVPALKPNERVTADLGKVTLSKLQWAKQEFEESAEAWKLTCSSGAVTFSTVTSDPRYEELSKTAVTPKAKEIPQNPRRVRPKRLPR